MASLKDLTAARKKGLIPGPEEKEDQFLARIKGLEYFFTHPPEDVDRFLTDGDWQGARITTERLYGFAPDWIVAHYSNSGLSFFQGAATWIISQNDLRIPLIQLREKFESGSLMKLYRREEVLSHEAVHAARMQFDEPIFEEFFAYKTSPHFWRRLLGPIFQKAWEAYLFLALLLIPFAIEISRFFNIDAGPYSLLAFLPLIYFAVLLLRLSFLHCTLAFAMKRMKPLLENSHHLWGAALFLKDREIFQFAFLRDKRFEKFLKGQEGLRWEMLSKCYFKK